MAITLDQGNIGTAHATGATSLALTTTHAVPAGGFITLAIQNYGASGATSVTGVSGGGLTWVEDAAGAWNANGNVAVRLWRANCPAGLPSGTVITISLDAASNVEAGATSWAAGADVAVDTFVTHPNGGTSAWTTGNMTIAAGSVIVAVSGEGYASSSPSTPTAPAVELIDMSASGVGELTTCYYAPGSAGTYALSGAWSSNVHGFSSTVGVAYKEVAAGTTYNDTPSGSLALSGSLTDARTYADSPSGTISLSGSSAEAHAVSDSPSGSIVLSGSITETFTPGGLEVHDSPSGTITLSGSLVEAHTVSSSHSGTISLSGSISEAKRYTDSPSGSITLSGAVIQAYDAVDAVSGTLTLSGSLAESHTAANDFALSPASDGTPTLTAASSDSLGVLAPTSDGNVSLTPVSDSTL